MCVTLDEKQEAAHIESDFQPFERRIVHRNGDKKQEGSRAFILLFGGG
jgi:hypothetical protein